MSSKPRTNPRVVQRARELRQDQTQAEEVLWRALRDRRVGHKIRRQHPLGRFIIDFYCHQAALCIEIDGDAHSEASQRAYDIARTQYLEDHGYRIVRFTNRDIQQNLQAVIDEICRTIDLRLIELSESTNGQDH
ncbi:MAG: DUF559 domain-containing protein [Anaerolineales bacterium]|nr:DUF559 domain-containing protein [Anaerolineales bacterium]